MNGKKILVTGGTGYIGSHMVVELIEAGYTPVVIDNLVNSKIIALDGIEKITGTRPTFYNVDLCDYGELYKVFSENDFEMVIHFAGLKAVAESIEQPIRYYDNNIGGTLNLLKCMKEFGCKKIIFSSSATVYGRQEKPRLTEDMTTGIGITNPYGETKFMIEQILKDVCISDAQFSAICLRYFNPVGNHESGNLGEDPEGIPNNLMPVIMKVASSEIPELLVYGNDYDTRDGSCIRDFIHVVDLVKGHLSAMNHMENGFQVYNLGTGRGTTVLEMIEAFQKVSGKELPHKIAPRRDGDLAEIYADAELAHRELGWKAERNIKDAMRDTLKYLSMQK